MPNLFEERELTLIDRLRVEAHWNESEKRNTAIANPPEGWVILETKVQVHGSNHGSRTVSTLAGGLSLETSERYSAHYQDVFDIAAKYIDDKGKAHEFNAKLEQLKKQHIEAYLKYNTNKNTVKATVSAKSTGTFIDQRRAWEEISVVCRCMYIGLVDKFDIIKQVGGADTLALVQAKQAGLPIPSSIQAAVGNFNGWYLDFSDNASPKKEGNYDVANNLLLAKQKGSGAFWRITPEKDCCTIQATAGKFNNWYLDFSDTAPVKREGNYDVARNLQLSKQKGSGAFWKITPEKETCTIQATAGNFKGWFLDFSNNAAVKREGNYDVADNLQLAKQSSSVGIWKKC